VARANRQLYAKCTTDLGFWTGFQDTLEPHL